MSQTTWNFIFIILTFTIYIIIAILSKVKSTKEFYIAGKGVGAVANGMATAADWMSAASFISLAGIISFQGQDGMKFLLGWTGGFVLLALFVAPYLRKFGKYTIPDFISERYYSNKARIISVICVIIICTTYLAGQMKGVGIVFSRLFEIDIALGVIIGSAIVFFYATLGGMKGITYTQVAQYCVMIFAYLIPACFLSLYLTDTIIPQFSFGSNYSGTDISLLEKLNQIHKDLGFSAYTSSVRPTIDTFCITASLMLGTAGLPHVIIRFFTTKNVSQARISAVYAILFIAILYTTASAVAVFGRTNLLEKVINKPYLQMGEWFKNWENQGLIAWVDKNNDGIIQYTKGKAFVDKPSFGNNKGQFSQRLITNKLTKSKNELYIDRDIIVLANPEIAGLPRWVIALLMAGALAAALSTASGLLLVIASAISHDIIKQNYPDISEKKELRVARISAAFVVVVSIYFGINPPGFVASTVALAFGIAASSLFPAIVLGIFSTKITKEGMISGVLTGLIFTLIYILLFKGGYLDSKYYLFNISPEGIGVIGMLLNMIVSFIVSSYTKRPSEKIQELILNVRNPKDAGEAINH